ncbi:hypothetical protein ASPVEDRAFT_46540 [Aspergillus versicolor CBS 583.65]|uniref:Uncharacterized protein n=1 Tax=Aspergillus versicolor CBS 583.65 TaxID=1036611 RepID=A0A1L9Q087_ASPVE|nr:uncharacterized protein ASPVEDRAFT_46540 [Aspergillus versicolor CBS 583.65]OJJ07179.1 hypothetical protein ASPVEDRAFT_46540 [Aspergillus versicolor CBS 583.65]
MIDQNVSSRYIKRWRLQQLLETLFPEVSNFHIRMIEDEWVFTVPKLVTEEQLDTVQDYD